MRYNEETLKRDKKVSNIYLINFLKLIGEVNIRIVISAFKSSFSIYSTSLFCNSELRARIRYRIRTTTLIFALYLGGNSPKNNILFNTHFTD